MLGKSVRRSKRNTSKNKKNPSKLLIISNTSCACTSPPPISPLRSPKRCSPLKPIRSPVRRRLLSPVRHRQPTCSPLQPTRSSVRPVRRVLSPIRHRVRHRQPARSPLQPTRSPLQLARSPVRHILSPIRQRPLQPIRSPIRRVKSPIRQRPLKSMEPIRSPVRARRSPPTYSSSYTISPSSSSPTISHSPRYKRSPQNQTNSTMSSYTTISPSSSPSISHSPRHKRSLPLNKSPRRVNVRSTPNTTHSPSGKEYRDSIFICTDDDTFQTFPQQTFPQQQGIPFPDNTIGIDITSSIDIPSMSDYDSRLRGILTTCNIVNAVPPTIQRQYPDNEVFVGKFNTTNAYLVYLTKDAKTLNRIFTTNKKLNDRTRGIITKCCTGTRDQELYLVYSLSNSNAVPLNDVLAGKFEQVRSFYAESMVSDIYNALFQLVANLVKLGYVCQLRVQDIIWCDGNTMMLMNNSEIRQSKYVFAMKPWSRNFMLYSLFVSMQRILPVSLEHDQMVLKKVIYYFHQTIGTITGDELARYGRNFNNAELVTGSAIKGCSGVPEKSEANVGSSFEQDMSAFAIGRKEKDDNTIDLSKIEKNVQMAEKPKAMHRITEFGATSGLKGTHNAKQIDEVMVPDLKNVVGFVNVNKTSS